MVLRVCSATMALLFVRSDDIVLSLADGACCAVVHAMPVEPAFGRALRNPSARKT
jgi:hypothetical protein